MFRFADIGRVWVAVEMPGGGEDGGRVTIHLLQDLFDRDALRTRERDVMTRTAGKLAEGAKTATATEDLERLFDSVTEVEAKDVEELVARTHDWRGVTDSDGSTTEFTRERLAAVLRFDWAFKAVRQALFTASREGVAKNSQPGPDGSPTPAQA